MKNRRIINKVEEHQHFSLRKLTIGMVSVLLGTSFLIFNNQITKADSISEQVTTTQAKDQLNQDNSEVNNTSSPTNSSISQSIQKKDNEGQSEQIEVTNKNLTFKNTVAKPSSANAPTINHSSEIKKNNTRILHDSKTVTRKIYRNINATDQEEIDTQSTTLIRNGHQDLTTHKVTWENWSEGEIKAFNPEPEITQNGIRYRVINPNEAPAVKVNSSDEFIKAGATVEEGQEVLPDVIFYYCPVVNKQQTISRKIYTQIDNKNKQFYQTQSITLNLTGTKNPWSDEVDWDHIKGKMPEFTAPKIAGYTVTNPNAGSSVNVDEKQTTLPDVIFYYKENTPTFHKVTQQQVLMRTIYGNFPDAKKALPIDKQTVTIKRTGEQNNSTGEIKWNDWEPVEIPKYTPQTTIIRNNIQYQLENGQEAAPAIKITNPNQKYKRHFTFKYIKEPNTTIISKGPGTVEIVTREIYSQTDQEGDPTLIKTQNIFLHRTLVKDNTTNRIIKRNPWEKQDMPAFEAPILKGFTCDDPEAAPVLHLGGNRTQQTKYTVTFYYTSINNPSTDIKQSKEVSRDIYVKYGHNKAEKIATQTVTVTRTGHKDPIYGEITWNKWEGQMPAQQVDEYVIKDNQLYHLTNPKAASGLTLGDNTPTKLADVTFIYEAIDHPHETRTVNRPVFYSYFNDQGQEVGAELQFTQQVSTSRDGTYDPQSKKVTWSSWKPVIIPAYIPPKNIVTWDGQTYKFDGHSTAVEIKNDGKHTNLPYVYLDFKEISSETLTNTRTLSREVYANYGGETIKDLGRQTITLIQTGEKNLKTNEVTWGPWQDTILPAYPASSELIINGIKYKLINPEDDSKKNIPGDTYELDDLILYYYQEKSDSKTFSRDIYTKIKGKLNKFDTQTVTLTRTGTINPFSGIVEWNNWPLMPKYSAPTQAGYTVINPEAGKAITINGENTKLKDVVFIYKSNTPQDTKTQTKSAGRYIYYNYYDEKGHKISGERFTIQKASVNRIGVLNSQTGKINWEAWSGIMPNYSAPNFLLKNGKYYKLTSHSGGEKLILTQPGYAGKATFNYKQILPQIINDTKVIERDIYCQYGNNEIDAEAYQRVTLRRTGIKDPVNGKISWNPWSKATINAFIPDKYVVKDGIFYKLTNPNAAPETVVDGSIDILKDIYFIYQPTRRTQIIKQDDGANEIGPTQTPVSTQEQSHESSELTNENDLQNNVLPHATINKLKISLTHNAYIYTHNLNIITRHGKKVVLKAGKTLTTWNNGKKYLLQNKQYYRIGENQYVKVSNTLSYYILKRNSLVYDANGQAIRKNRRRILLKKGSRIHLKSEKIINIRHKKLYEISRGHYIRTRNVAKIVVKK